MIVLTTRETPAPQPLPPLKTVTMTMTPREATILGAILGQVTYFKPITSYGRYGPVTTDELLNFCGDGYRLLDAARVQ